LISNTLNVSSEDARKVKKSVIFFVIKKFGSKEQKVCKYKWEDILSKWLKSVSL